MNVWWRYSSAKCDHFNGHFKCPPKNGLIWYSTSILGSWNSHWPFETFGHWGPELSITRGHVGPVAQGWTVEQPEICAARSFHTGRIGGAGEQHWMVMFGWSKQCGAVLIYTGSIHVNTHCINSYGPSNLLLRFPWTSLNWLRELV